MQVIVLFCAALLLGCAQQKTPQAPAKTVATDGTGSITVISDVVGMVLIDGAETGTRVKSNGTVTINGILNGDTQVAVKLDDGTIVKASGMVLVKTGETAQVHIAAPAIAQAEPVKPPVQETTVPARPAPNKAEAPTPKAAPTPKKAPPAQPAADKAETPAPKAAPAPKKAVPAAPPAKPAPIASAPPPQQPAQTEKTSSPMDGTWEDSEAKQLMVVDRNLFLSLAPYEEGIGKAGEIFHTRSLIDMGQWGLLPYVFSGNKLTLKAPPGSLESDLVLSRSSKTPDSFTQKTALEGDWRWTTESLASMDEKKRNERGFENIQFSGMQRILFRGSWIMFPDADTKNENAYIIKIGSGKIMDPGSNVMMSYQVSGNSLVLTFPNGTKITYTKVF
jgi:outer membrane biosynthesis protein TonB